MNGQRFDHVSRVLAAAVVTVALIEAQLGAASASDTFFIEAVTPTWTSTGIVLMDGQTATITAVGTASCIGVTGVCETGPDGASTELATGDFLVNGVPKWSLVGKVDAGDGVFIGSGPTQVGGPGELFLAYNDDVYGDNGAGSL